MLRRLKPKFRRKPNEVSKLFDLIVALNERRKHLEARIKVLQTAQEEGVNIFAAERLLERQKEIEERAGMEQTRI